MHYIIPHFLDTLTFLLQNSRNYYVGIFSHSYYFNNASLENGTFSVERVQEACLPPVQQHTF